VIIINHLPNKDKKNKKNSLSLSLFIIIYHYLSLFIIIYHYLFYIFHSLPHNEFDITILSFDEAVETKLGILE
jgi:hypothetical protein